MIKSCVIVFLLQGYFVPDALGMDIVMVRKMFYEAACSRPKTEELLRLLSHSENQQAFILAGYAGMCHMLLARYSYNPVFKLASFSKGKAMLEHAISSDKSNVELRFLRLSVQLNVPAFLGYSGELEQDKRFILREYATLADADLKGRIRSLMSAIGIPLN